MQCRSEAEMAIFIRQETFHDSTVDMMLESAEIMRDQIEESCPNATTDGVPELCSL